MDFGFRSCITCYNINLFTRYESANENAMLAAKDVSYKLIGVGTIKIKKFIGLWEPCQMFFMCQTWNLASLGDLGSSDCSYSTKGRAICTQEGNHIIIIGKRVGRNLNVP